VTVSQIIDEIKSLPPEEQLKVIHFAYRIDAERQLSGEELSSLAERMANSTDAGEAALLREAIFRLVYREKPTAVATA